MAKKKSSINGGEPTPLRRSNRILLLNSGKLQKPNSSKIQVCVSPISCYSTRFQLSSPIREGKIQSCSKKSTRSVDRVEKSHIIGCRRSPRFANLENITEISEKKTPLRRSPRFSGMAVLGLRVKECSKISTRKIDGVGEFKDCRRSPRFLTARNSPRVLEKKGSAKGKDGFEGVSGGLASIPEIAENKKWGKSRKGAKGSVRKNNVVKGKSREELDREACVNRVCGDSAECLEEDVSLQGRHKRESVKKGKSSVEMLAVTEFQTPNIGMEKKRMRNVSCESKENWECGIIREVEEGILSHLETPFGSVKNIGPEKGKLVCYGNSSKEIVESKGVLKKTVKPAGGLRKNSEKAVSKQNGAQGWTKEQEIALQRAYLKAKPSPHFWKKISKMVPGKNAQDCFDKIQSNSISTPQPQTRNHSRVNKTNPSPLSHFSLSGSKLLESAKPTVRKSRVNKRTKCQAHKTARHILQKQNLATQGFHRDLFSILEPSVNTQIVPEMKSVVTPISKVQSFFPRSSSSNKKKSFSRFRDSSLTPLVSPPVLKPVKNMAIHEKYIDQLHNREAKRMAGGRKCGGVGDDRKGKVQKVDVIKTAKNALVCDARDMIKTFQQMQANDMTVSEEDFDDEMSDGEDIFANS